MPIALGIDTGGTYTDAVVVDQESGAVVSAAKALTTYYDLSEGIHRAVSRALDAHSIAPRNIDLVALSTTLATNAIVEGVGSPVCLLLIGYDSALIRRFDFGHQLVTDDVVYVRGGHDAAGNEAEPLDMRAVRKAVLARRERVEAFAVSGYFSVRNPTHELRVRELVRELTTASVDPGAASTGMNPAKALPVTCGHELSSRLNSVRRATTAALNARLIPLLQELIETLGSTLHALGVVAPLMVVKGDGSLVRAEWAIRRPIETILSGPAASVVGAWHLASRGRPTETNHRDVWVVDVGGTTTDIASLTDGRPRLDPEGAQVGEWKTMVEAVDVYTVGLGGDSQVQLTFDRPTAAQSSAFLEPQSRPHLGSGWLAIGPQRVVPLCLLASEHPQVVSELQRQTTEIEWDALSGQFIVAQRRPTRTLQVGEKALLDQLSDGPRSLLSLVRGMDSGTLALRHVQRMEAERLVLRSGFTPTDALHSLERLDTWNREASQLGARLLAARAGLSPQELCEQVVGGVSDLAVKALISKVLGDEAVFPEWGREPSASAMLARALDQIPASDLKCQLTLHRPVVAIGAPVAAYMPRLAERLNTELVIPRYAHVANAVGAVSGGVVQRLRVRLRPMGFDQIIRLHLPDGVHDFQTTEAAVAYAEKSVFLTLEAQTRDAGADQVEVQVVRRDLEAPSATGELVYLGTDLDFTAVGRPHIAATNEAAS
jgi:N-methylhydantoinase A/oxoprolinase/acetone carboxylase beta subunit